MASSACVEVRRAEREKEEGKMLARKDLLEAIVVNRQEDGRPLPAAAAAQKATATAKEAKR